MTEENDQEQERTLANSKKFIAKFGAIYSGIVAIISDILQPLLDFTLIFLVLCGAVLAGEIAIGLCAKSPKGRELNAKLKKLTDNFWLKPILWATSIAFCVLLTMFLLNDDTEDGFLAEHSETVRSLQKDLGLINERLEEIAEHTRQTAQNTKEIAEQSKATAKSVRETAGNTAEIAETSKETAEHAKATADNTGRLVEQGEKTTELLERIVNPEDARKKLSQIGVPYTISGFRSKVMEGDLETLKLFYEAGWDPLTPNAGFPGISPIFLALAQQTPNYLGVLAQAIEEGKYEPNKKIKVDLMSTFGREIMGLFEWLNAPNVLIYQGQNRVVNANLGYLIAVLIRMPDKDVLSFVNAFHLDMKDGISFRNSIINKNYIIKAAQKQTESMYASMPAQIREAQKKHKSAVDAALINALFPPDKEKLFQKRSKEYRKGTQELAAAAGGNNQN